MPSYITSSIQYGPNIKALSVYLIRDVESKWKTKNTWF
jgi:hypothetical protein